MNATSPVKVLVVDDLEANLLVYRELFAHIDAELLAANSGRDALELLLEHEVALALIDVQMPGMDGFELAELMRGASRTASVPIIFITAGTDGRHRIFHGYELGAVDFLLKPIEPHVLNSKVSVFVELQRQRRQLEQTLRLNEELVAIVSHDLRSPLHTISLAAEVVEQGAHSEVATSAAGRIKRSIRRMTGILNQLLDLSRARLGGGIPIERHGCDLGELAESVVEELRPSTEEGQLLVSSRGDLRGQWDSGRLQQVLSNLLGNALRHGNPGRPVTLTLDGSNEEIARVSVHNHGEIPKGVRSTLFEPFVGAETVRLRGSAAAAHKPAATKSERSDSLGLGLYIVQQVVLAHGGVVDASSDPVRGTTFEVSLPRQEVR